MICRWCSKLLYPILSGQSFLVNRNRQPVLTINNFWAYGYPGPLSKATHSTHILNSVQWRRCFIFSGLSMWPARCVLVNVCLAIRFFDLLNLHYELQSLKSDPNGYGTYQLSESLIQGIRNAPMLWPHEVTSFCSFKEARISPTTFRKLHRVSRESHDDTAATHQLSFHLRKIKIPDNSVRDHLPLPPHLFHGISSFKGPGSEHFPNTGCLSNQIEEVKHICFKKTRLYGDSSYSTRRSGTE